MCTTIVVWLYRCPSFFFYSISLLCVRRCSAIVATVTASNVNFAQFYFSSFGKTWLGCGWLVLSLSYKITQYLLPHRQMKRMMVFVYSYHTASMHTNPFCIQHNMTTIRIHLKAERLTYQIEKQKQIHAKEYGQMLCNPYETVQKQHTLSLIF